MRRQIRPFAVSPFAGPLTAFADNITAVVSCLLDIEAVKKTIAGYERIAGAKVNFDKSEGLWLGAWTGSDTLPDIFAFNVQPMGVWLCLIWRATG